MDVRRFSADATAVLDSLGDRLPADDQDSLRTYLGAGEWGLLADELAAALLEDATPIAAAERDLVRDLLFAFDADARRRRAAPVHPRPGAGARRAERRQRPTSSVAISSAALSRPVRSRTTRTREQYSAYTGRSQPPRPQE